jgi:hypothetical protein
MGMEINSEAGMFVDEWWAFMIFSLLAYCTGACFLIRGIRSFLYHLSPALESVVPCKNPNCTFMMQVYVLYHSCFTNNRFLLSVFNWDSKSKY